MQKSIKELKRRIKEWEKFSEITVVHHFDMDGCCSASLLYRLFNKLNIKGYFIPATIGFEQVVIEKLKKQNPEKVLLVDYIPGSDLIAALKGYNVEIIDHHHHEKHLEVFDYFTSIDFDTHVSVSYLLYCALKELGFENLGWIAEIGAFWDKCLEETEFWKKDVYKKELANMLPFNLVVSFTQTKGASKIVTILDESSSFDEAIEKVKESEDYKIAKDVFEKEFREVEFSRKAYPDIKLNMYWIKTRFKHIRVYVDYISYQKTGTNIFILNEDSQFKFSFRTSLDINLVNIVRNLAGKVPDFGGGGHTHACGGLLRNENVEGFLDEFIKEYRKAISPDSPNLVF
jgi:single-stranded DNA-specific DHH superfamily exonuclease